MGTVAMGAEVYTAEEEVRSVVLRILGERGPIDEIELWNWVDSILAPRSADGEVREAVLEVLLDENRVQQNSSGHLELTEAGAEEEEWRSAQIHCSGCGLWVARSQVVEREHSERDCARCVTCHEDPKMRATYRRGFNDGLDAVDRALHRVVTKSNLRRREEREEEGDDHEEGEGDEECEEGAS